MAETKRSTGTVKWFSAQKGFGFIAPDDSGEDLFVHQTSIQSDGFRTLSDGQPVEFYVDLGEDGRTKAVDVVGVSRSRRPPRGVRGGGGGRGYYGGRGRGGGGGGYERGGFSRGGGYGGGGSSGGPCFNCGRYGHLARDCYEGSGGGGGERYGVSGGGGRYGGGGGGRYGGGGGRGYSGGGGGGGCYNCGEEGHFARDCPNTNNK